MKSLRLSGYAMTKRLEGKVSRTAVYRFLSDGGSTDCETLEAWLADLGLRVVVARKDARRD